MPSRGVLAYALPAWGRLYLEGQQNGMDMAMATAAYGPITIGAHFLYWIGFIALGVAVWRSVEGLSRWAGVLLALYGPLMHGPLFVVRIGGLPIVSILGAVLLVLGGVLVARAVLRRDPEKLLERK